MIENQVKFGYLNKQDILKAIENGILGAYSIVFSKDEKCQYLVLEDLSLLEIRSRLNIYDSVEIARISINNDSATYEGQIVSILSGDHYRGFIVNKFGDEYDVTDLCNNPDAIDYDQLRNVPIINLYGTSDNPIDILVQPDGTYMVKGVYIAPDGTKQTTLVGHYYSKYNNNITKIASDKITKYVIDADGNVSSSDYITEDYLRNKEYIQKKDLDVEVSNLGYVKSNDIVDIVEETIDEKLINITEEEIEDLFDEKNK